MKRNTKFIVSFIFLLGFLFGSIVSKVLLYNAINVSAEESVYEGFVYELNGLEISIIGYTEELDYTNLTIPDEIDGYPVTKIEANVFKNLQTKKLKLGKNIKYIGAHAFEGPWLTEIVLPENIIELGYEAFYEDSNGHLSHIEKISIPTYTSSVPKKFLDRFCTINEFTVEEGNKYFSSDQGILYNFDKSILISCPPKKIMSSYSIPDSTVQINENAFYCCSISEIIISPNVTYIGKNAFNIEKLQVVSIPNKIVSIGDNAFQYNNISKIIVPSTATDILPVFFNGTSLTEIYVENDNINYLSDYGILYTADKSELIKCPSLSNCYMYSVLEGTKTIESLAFANSTIEIITLPASIESIKANAFKESNLSVIKGYTGSYAEKYANDNGYQFISIGNINDIPVKNDYNYDVNCDGKINVLDLIGLKKYLLYDLR